MDDLMREALETELYGKISIGKAESGSYDRPEEAKRLSSKPFGVDRFYLVSNEDYCDASLSAVGSLVGIIYYIGVCGGGTQNLCLLGKLLEKNNIERIRLVDKERRQLDNLGKIGDIYNKSDGDEKYSAALIRHAGGPLNMIYASVNERKPKIRRDITIDTWMGLAEDYLKNNVNERGRYFVYLSNALFGWIKEGESCEMLDRILSDEKFEDGSAVFFYSVRRHGGVMLEKRNGSLSSPDGAAVYMPEERKVVYKDDDILSKLSKTLHI